MDRIWREMSGIGRNIVEASRLEWSQALAKTRSDRIT